MTAVRRLIGDTRVTWVVRTDLYLAKVLDSWIGLDLASGRYVLMRGEVGEQLDRFSDHRATAADVASLRGRGILEPDRGRKAPFAPTISFPSSSLRHKHAMRPSLRLTIEAVWSQMSTRRQLARHQICDTLGDVSREVACGSFATVADCQEIVQAFDYSKRLISQRDQCLARGVAMCRMLARRGKRVRLVIGVTLPFIAHCWVQAEDIVLSDGIDRVRAYVPILAV